MPDSARHGSFDTRLTQFVFIVSALLMNTPTAKASDSKIKTWVEWQEQGIALVDEGRYAAATQAFRNALDEVVQAHESPRHLATVYNSLGGVYTLSGRYLEAETQFRCALEIEKSELGSASLEYAIVSASIALLPTHSADREQAIQILKTAIARDKGARTHSDITIAQDYLIKLLYLAENFEDAEAFLSDWQDTFHSANTHLDRYGLAELLNNEAVLEDHLGHEEEAVKLDQKAIHNLESALGMEHPSLVVPLNNLATIYAKLNRYDEAQRAFLRADAICVRTLGENHPNHAVLLANYAVVLRKMGHKKESKKINSQAQEIEQAANRRNGVGTTISMSALRASNQ